MGAREDDGVTRLLRPLPPWHLHVAGERAYRVTDSRAIDRADSQHGGGRYRQADNDRYSVLV